MQWSENEKVRKRRIRIRIRIDIGIRIRFENGESGSGTMRLLFLPCLLACLLPCLQLDHHKLPFLSSPRPYQLITSSLITLSDLCCKQSVPGLRATYTRTIGGFADKAARQFVHLCVYRHCRAGVVIVCPLALFLPVPVLTSLPSAAHQ